jgi:transketolase
MRKQFVSTVEKLIPSDKNLTLLLGDIGVFGFRNSLRDFPDRVYNIGILEQTTISLAAGLSKTGLIPIVHTIAPFMVERAYEQLKIDFGYQNLGGNFVSIGSSYDYCNLGPTHHCPGDVHILKKIPNFQIVVPGNSKEFDILFNEYYNNGMPTYFRLSDFENKKDVTFDPGKGSLVRKGSAATVICVGNMLDVVVDATSDLDVTLLYYNVIAPFDIDCLIQNFNENIIVCEPYYVGLLNVEINRVFVDRKTRILNIGVPDTFFDKFGTKKENDEYYGLDTSSIREKIEKFINE